MTQKLNIGLSKSNYQILEVCPKNGVVRLKIHLNSDVLFLNFTKNNSISSYRLYRLECFINDCKFYGKINLDDEYTTELILNEILERTMMAESAAKEAAALSTSARQERQVRSL